MAVLVPRTLVSSVQPSEEGNNGAGDGGKHGVWLPYYTYDPSDANIDVFIAHRSCEHLTSSARIKYLWLHDVIVECFGQVLPPCIACTHSAQAEIYDDVAGVFALSNYHARMLPRVVSPKVRITRFKRSVTRGFRSWSRGTASILHSSLMGRIPLLE
jgi:hypothetical protein